MTDGKPKQRKLKCDGETGAYTNVDTGEKDVQLVGCTSVIKIIYLNYFLYY